MKRTALFALLCVVAATLGGCRGSTEPFLDRCPDPAPIEAPSSSDVPDEYSIDYRTGVDAQAETARLEKKYDFTAQNVYSYSYPGFTAKLTADQLARIRCEPTILDVSRDHVVAY
jgi:hypothetical protein